MTSGDPDTDLAQQCEQSAAVHHPLGGRRVLLRVAGRYQSSDHLPDRGGDGDGGDGGDGDGDGGGGGGGGDGGDGGGGNGVGSRVARWLLYSKENVPETYTFGREVRRLALRGNMKSGL